MVTADPIRIAVPPIAHLLEENGSGIYQRLLKEAMEPVGADIKSVFFPYRRAIVAFDDRDVDCIYSFGDVLDKRYSPKELVSSYPLGKFSFHIFTVRGEPPISSVGDWQKLRLAAIMGHELYLDSVLAESGKVVMVGSEQQAVRMLERGRVEAVIAAVPDINPFLPRLSYEQGYELLVSFDRLHCHNTESNRVFIETLSEQLKKLKASGGYARCRYSVRSFLMVT